MRGPSSTSSTPDGDQIVLEAADAAELGGLLAGIAGWIADGHAGFQYMGFHVSKALNPDPSGGQSRGPRTVAGCLIGLVVLRGAVVAAFRPGWVLDDWTLVGRTSGLGVWHTLDGTTNARSRPGAWVVFNTVYPRGGMA